MAPARPGARSGGENALVADRGGGGGDLDRDARSDVAQELIAELEAAGGGDSPSADY